MQNTPTTREAWAMIYGLLNIHKPATWTSRDVVDRIEQHAHGCKVGHAGTLDPLATGVLVVCVGGATRLVPQIQAQSKTYLATFLWGRRSPSDDIDTEVEILPGLPIGTNEMLLAVLPRFVGTIRQVPSAFSAVKVNGQPAYKKAHKGRPVEVPEREVVVEQIILRENTEEVFTLEIICGGGTYVRSIGRDIAIACGSSAVMSALCRTRVGAFTLEDAIDPASVHRRMIAEQVLSPLLAIPDYPRLAISEIDMKRILHGNPALAEYPAMSGPVALLCEGDFVAIAEFDLTTGRYWPKVVLRDRNPS